MNLATERFDNRPLLVLWETTRACALACRHCRADAQPNPGADELSTQEAVSLLDQLAELERPRPICVLSGGDCLARPDFDELVRHAVARHVHVAIAPSVTPRLTVEAARRVRALGVRVVSLSLDGASAATHDRVRGVPGHFEATIERLAMLKAEGFSIQVNTTVMACNLEELASVAALLVRLGVDVWEVFFVIGTGRGTMVEATTAAQNEEVCNFLVDASCYGMTVRTVEAPFFRRVAAERRSTRGGAARSEAVGAWYRDSVSELRRRLGPPTGTPKTPSSATRDGRGIVFVAANGDVLPSGFLPIRLGSVREVSLIDIYRDHPLLRAIRASAFSGPCGTCRYSDLCGGSRSRAYAVHGDPLSSDPGCVLAAA